MLHLFFRPLLVLMLMFGHWNLPDAALPLNDDFAAAEAIPALPFTTTVDVSEATVQADEPQSCTSTDRTVWYSFTASETMILLADTLGSIGTSISIYTAFEPGWPGLLFVQCANFGGAATFRVEAGQTYYIQVGAMVGEAGTVQLALSQAVAISGRLVDAASGAPLARDAWPFAWAALYLECGDGCLEQVSWASANADGWFWFHSYEGFAPGTYVIQVTANLYPFEQFGPYEFTGEDLDVGDLALDPLPKIRSIRGRLLDQTSGGTIPRIFFPSVYLYRCTEGYCSEYVNSQEPDSEGRFRFDTDAYGNQLPAGRYLIQTYADQYNPLDAQYLELSEGERATLGTLRLRSFPVRFSDDRTCYWVPASGGDCDYSVRVWNGLAADFEGDIWSMASTLLPDSVVGFTNFQVKEPQELSLKRGESQVVRFRLRVPAGGASSESGLCLRLLVGRGGNAFFNTVGFRDLYCVYSDGGGFAIVPAKNARTAPPIPVPYQRVAGMESKPNNTCQEAQDIGAPSLPFSMQGNLDSSQTADIDFYRLSGTPGEWIVVSHQGQFTGQGTLSDPLLGVFDSNCNLIASNDDSSGSPDSRVLITIPADGLFTLAATAYPDGDFVGGGNGTYQLTVSRFEVSGTISGRLTDAITGLPLPGDAAPFAIVGLMQCEDFGCIWRNGQTAGSDGSFSFTHDYDGMPLGAGNYRVAAIADQYQYVETGTFTLGEGEVIETGDVPLTPWLVQISDRQDCAISSEGGTCEYSVRVTNPYPTRFSGKAWSLVYASPLGSFIDGTTFQSDAPLHLNLAPGASQTLRFRFRVRGAVPDGAYVCTEVYAGQNPNPYFTTVGGAFIFCAVKGPDGLSMMSPAEAQKTLWQMKLEMRYPTRPSGKMLK